MQENKPVRLDNVRQIKRYQISILNKFRAGLTTIENAKCEMYLTNCVRDSLQTFELEKRLDELEEELKNRQNND